MGGILYKNDMKTLMISSLNKSKEHRYVPMNKKNHVFENSGENLNKSYQKTIKTSLLNKGKELN